MMETNKKLYSYKCVDCGSDIQLSYATHLRLSKTGRSPRCKKCNYIKRGKDKKEWYKNLSQEEKDKLIEINSKSHKKFYDNLSDEKKKEIQNHMKSVQNNLMKNLSKKEQDELKLKRKKGLLEYFNNLSEEEKEKKIKTSINNLQKIFDNKDTYRDIWAESARNRYNKMTDEEKHKFMEKIWKGHDKWYNNLTEEEKQEFNYNTLVKRSSWYSSLSEEQKQELKDKIKESWSRLSMEERSERVKNILLSGQGNNKFHKKFWDSFQHSHISNRFYLVPETVLFYDDGKYKFSKSWDYGIYSKDNNKLIMVVDLDGVFFHGDNSDYNGYHSKEEYDERRFLSVPEGIKYHIINDFEFSKSFESMIKSLMMDYNDFVDNQFKICRSLIDVPYPTYSDAELFKSYDQLLKLKCDDKYHKSISLNNREGDRLINHFHHSIYGAKRKDSKYSPYEAWYNDELLLKVIKNRMIYVNKINPNKILQGFNISKVAPKVSVFSAGRAKLLIYKYLYNMNEIFDPFSGFSGRMLGTISLGKRYIGQDISEIHIRESNSMLKFLKSIGINSDVYLEERNILNSSGIYQSLFTCPPYSDKEQWLEVPIDKRTCDDWITECLSRFKCKKYLFVVDNTEKYRDYIVEEIQNKFHFSTNKEYVILV